MTPPDVTNRRRQAHSFHSLLIAHCSLLIVSMGRYTRWTVQTGMTVRDQVAGDMRVRLRKLRVWAIAGMVSLGVGIVVIVARGRQEGAPGTLSARVQQAIKSRQWSRAESLLDRLAGL